MTAISPGALSRRSQRSRYDIDASGINMISKLDGTLISNTINASHLPPIGRT